MVKRVALVTIHTSPLAAPGTGDAGGMNVYVDALAATLARRGVEVDVFTRGDRASTVTAAPGYRVVEVPAVGDDPASAVAVFAEGVAKWAARHYASYDVVHSHYWLSGWAGALLQESLGAPLAISFHTLGRVKEAGKSPGEPRESLTRIAAEIEVISRAECLVASTPADAADLIEHYQAPPERICVAPPGVDHDVFTPGDREEARSRLGLASGPLVSFVGRVQALKAADVAIRAVARIPGCRLLIVGGPSGPDGDAVLADLVTLAERVAPGRVDFCGPIDHGEVVDVYRASDVVVVPSRSESFGLVALEAMAAGVPVVAARVGGLPYLIVDGASGILVPGHDPESYATAIRSVIDDADVARRLSLGARSRAADYSWDTTVDRLLELYRGMA